MIGGEDNQRRGGAISQGSEELIHEPIGCRDFFVIPRRDGSSARRVAVGRMRLEQMDPEEHSPGGIGVEPGNGAPHGLVAWALVEWLAICPAGQLVVVNVEAASQAESFVERKCRNKGAGPESRALK